MRRIAVAAIGSLVVSNWELEYEQGDIGEVLFRVACNMGLEGIVSKRIDRAYHAGKCKHWVKVKNPAHGLQQSQGSVKRSRHEPKAFPS